MKLITAVLFFILVDYMSTEPLPLSNNGKKNQHINAFYQKCGAVCNAIFCDVSYTCRPVNRTSKLLKLDIYFHQNVRLQAPIQIRITTFKKFVTQYRPSLIDTSFELCQELLRKTHPILTLFQPPHANDTVFNPCPISGHRYLIPTYTSTWIAHLIPVGEWRLDFIVTKIMNGSEKHIVTVSDYYLLKPTGATEF